MSQLSWMITITDRKKAPDFVALYQQQNIHVSLTTVGAGTAVSETLNYLGLERTEKAVIFTTVTDSRWKAVKRQLEHTMNPAPALRLPSLSAALAASVRCNF